MNNEPFKIDLSGHWVRHLEEDEIRDTIMHEIAHAIAGVEAGHGPRWAAVASRLGATPRATGKVGSEIFKEVKSNISKYRASCGKCNTEYFFDRMTVAWRTGRHRCGHCRGSLELKTLY